MNEAVLLMATVEYGQKLFWSEGAEEDCGCRGNVEVRRGD
jgi:hypothetical protein